MKRMRFQAPPPGLGARFEPKLNVIEYISTMKGDAERGPMLRLNSSKARLRLLQDGELAWVAGPRRQDLAELVIDDAIPQGHVALRDVAGVAISETVTVTKPDLDTPPQKRYFG
ncbi:MAG: hypothetical protein ABIS03_10915 [Gemmatimonadaceae bacterium]